MKRGVWGSMVLVAVAMNGCPSPTQCAQGTYNEALRRCVGDCRDPSSPSCYDTGVATDASDVATPPDVPSSMMEAGPSCMAPQQLCGGSCVDTTANVAHCGSCDPCASMAGATASCAMGACTYTCLPGFERSGTSCDVMAPRPIWPPGTSTVTSLRPTFKWVNPAGVDGARVQVCRDRACTMVVATIDAAGESARPMADLPTSAALFWRIQGRVASTTGTRTSPTWQLRTRAVGATVDTAHGVDLDVNGDGFSDLAVQSTSNGVDVFHGTATGVAADRTLNIPTINVSLAAPIPMRMIAAAGDVDGDGYGDFVVGEPAMNSGSTSRAGCVKLHRGSAAGLALSATPFVCGTNANDGIGIAVSGIGDVNGDGFADVAVAAPNVAAGGRTGAGIVMVFFGRAGGLAAAPSRTFEGDAADVMGSAVASSLDLNGDQFSDIIIGSNGGGAGGGEVVIWNGGPTLASMPTQVLTGPAAPDLFGSAIGAGDFNGDGYGDIAVGLPLGTTAGVGSDAGSAWLYLGSASGFPASANTVLRATESNSFFGHSIAGVGDVDGDGVDDFLIGAPTSRPAALSNAGAAHFFRGHRTSISASSAQTFNGGAAGDNVGFGVGGGGDVNGDGLRDFAFGAPNADPRSNDTAGTVIVVHGRSGTLITSQTLNGVRAMDRLGVVIARAPVRSVYQHRACLARR